MPRITAARTLYRPPIHGKYCERRWELREPYHGTTKLEPKEVRFILRATSWTGPELAEKFGVTPAHIYNIRAGRCWGGLS